MVDFCRRGPDGRIEVFADGAATWREGSFATLFDGIARGRLSTAAAARKTASRVLATTRLVPLHLDAATLLVPLSGDRPPAGLFVNFRAIAATGVRGGGAVVRFRDGTLLAVPSARTLARGLRLARRLEAYLEGSGSR